MRRERLWGQRRGQRRQRRATRPHQRVFFGKLRAPQVHESAESYVGNFLDEQSYAHSLARQAFFQQKQVIEKERVDLALCRGAVHHGRVGRRASAFVGASGEHAHQALHAHKVSVESRMISFFH